MGIHSRSFALCMPVFRFKTKTQRHRSIQPKAGGYWGANRNLLNLANGRVVITAGIMLGRPIIPHRDRSWPPFHPQLISRVLNTAIKTTNHGIEFVGCQLINRLCKGRIHK